MRASEDEYITERIRQHLTTRHYDFSSGIPCGVLEPFILALKNTNQVHHVIAQAEPEAVGICAGAYLAGKKPVLYMQNSGFFKALNDYTSLVLPCKLPLLSIVSFRGCEGEDAPQHFINGSMTEKIISSTGLRTVEIDDERLESALSTADELICDGHPTIILAKRKWHTQPKNSPVNKRIEHHWETYRENTTAETYNSHHQSKIHDLTERHEAISRNDALDTIIRNTKIDNAIISTTGIASRYLYDRHDSPNQFYNTGGFGLASSIGLGFALGNQGVKTIVIDGDGSLLTNFGTLVTIGTQNPDNMTHIVLDNEQYASCSGESTCSRSANIPLSAAIHGYQQVYIANSATGIDIAMDEARRRPGLQMVAINIRPGGGREYKRPLDLGEMATRFKTHFASVHEAR